MARFHDHGEHHLDAMHREVPWYDEAHRALRTQTLGLEVRRVLDLGTGTGATLRTVPLLPPDGAPTAGALYEGLKRGIARPRGRPDPGHVDVAKLLPVAYVVGLAMLVMGVVLIVADIVVPLRLS